MNNRRISTCMAVLFSLAPLLACPVFADNGENGDIGEKIRQPVRESVEIRRQTQKETEQWREERKELTARYERLLEENRRLSEQSGRLEEEVEAARTRIDRKERQLADIDRLSEDIEPFLEEVVTRIRALDDEAPPFLVKERKNRHERIGAMMDDPETPVSERYRKVMEALLVEAEYANTIEVYRETIDIGERSLLADIFRLGRISLFYQSLDGQESGWFNVAENRWETLPRSHNRAIATAIDIGARRQPAELLSLPLGRLVVE